MLLKIIKQLLSPHKNSGASEITYTSNQLPSALIRQNKGTSMVLNLFSYAISKHKIDLTDDYINKVIDYGKNNIKENGQTEGNLHKTELFEPLAKIFINAVCSHAEELGFADNEFVITQMWLNCYVKDDFLDIHTHPNSIYSGVFYIGENLKHGTIFLKPTPGNQVEIQAKTMNEYTTDSAIIKPENNLLVIFPSYLQHRAEKNLEDKNRYTISFNCLPKTFGEESKLNHFIMP
jgi:uncharacterized protein (TIGR02466 family)